MEVVSTRMYSGIYYESCLWWGAVRYDESIRCRPIDVTLFRLGLWGAEAHPPASTKATEPEAPTSGVAAITRQVQSFVLQTGRPEFAITASELLRGQLGSV